MFPTEFDSAACRRYASRSGLASLNRFACCKASARLNSASADIGSAWTALCQASNASSDLPSSANSSLRLLLQAPA
jgi:hypothetical protein